MTNSRGDNTLLNWDPFLEDKFVTKTCDQLEPGSFFPRSLWGWEMKDPGNEVDIIVEKNYYFISLERIWSTEKKRNYLINLNK